MGHDSSLSSPFAMPGRQSAYDRLGPFTTAHTVSSPEGPEASSAAVDCAIAAQTRARLDAQAAELRYLEQARETEERVRMVMRQIEFAKAAADAAILRAKQQAAAREAAEARLQWAAEETARLEATFLALANESQEEEDRRVGTDDEETEDEEAEEAASVAAQSKLDIPVPAAVVELTTATDVTMDAVAAMETRVAVWKKEVAAGEELRLVEEAAALATTLAAAEERRLVEEAAALAATHAAASASGSALALVKQATRATAEAAAEPEVREAPTPVDALRAELDGLTNKQLRARAKAGKATTDELEDAADSEEPRAALLDLLVELEMAPTRAGGSEARVEPDCAVANTTMANPTQSEPAPAMEPAVAERRVVDYSVDYSPSLEYSVDYQGNESPEEHEATAAGRTPQSASARSDMLEVELTKSATTGFGLDISPAGEVASCTPGGVADAAGVPGRCRIVSVNGVDVSSKAEVKAALGRGRPGQPVPFRFEVLPELKMQDEPLVKALPSEAAVAEQSDGAAEQSDGTVATAAAAMAPIAPVDYVDPAIHAALGEEAQEERRKEREEIDVNSPSLMSDLERAIAEADAEMSTASDDEAEEVEEMQARPESTGGPKLVPDRLEEAFEQPVFERPVVDKSHVLARDTSEDEESSRSTDGSVSPPPRRADQADVATTATTARLHQREEEELAATAGPPPPAGMSQAVVLMLHRAEEQECTAEVQVLPTPLQVEVTFDRSGALGLRFAQEQGEQMHLTGITPNSQAARCADQLCKGMRLRVIKGVKYEGTNYVPVEHQVLKYADAISTLRTIGRPVTLVFDPVRPFELAAATAGGGREAIEALYSRFSPAKLSEVEGLIAKYGEAELLRMVRKKYLSPREEIDALYTQHNPEKLCDVENLVGKYGEAELLRMVRKKYKSAGAAGQPPPPPASPEPTGKAAAMALQQHLAAHGTSDVKKITRLRRASMAPDTAPQR